VKGIIPVTPSTDSFCGGGIHGYLPPINLPSWDLKIKNPIFIQWKLHGRFHLLPDYKNNP